MLWKQMIFVVVLHLLLPIFHCRCHGVEHFCHMVWQNGYFLYLCWIFVTTNSTRPRHKNFPYPSLFLNPSIFLKLVWKEIRETEVLSTSGLIFYSVYRWWISWCPCSILPFSHFFSRKDKLYLRAARPAHIFSEKLACFTRNANLNVCTRDVHQCICTVTEDISACFFCF